MANPEGASDPNRSGTPEEPERLSSNARNERKHAERKREKAVREMIVKKLSKETVYCTNQDFIEHYLPPIPDDVDVDFVLDSLRYGWYLQKREGYEQNLLGELSEKPSDIKAREGELTNEKAIFAPLANIVTAIRKALGSSKNPFYLRMVPEARVKTDIRTGCRVRIDACTTATSGPQKTLRTTDIVVPFEFKVHSTNVTRQENRSQIVSAIMHIMNDDVRRNFAYAVTIEDDRVSLWYLSRSHSVKATSFSYVIQPEKLVEVLIALSCATEEQLGYDPRITLLQDRTYLYEFAASEEPEASDESSAAHTPDDSHPVESTSDFALSPPSTVYYKMTKKLHEGLLFGIAGRCTRIFQAKQVNSKEDLTTVMGAEEVVIKDVWIDADKPTEAQLLSQVLEDIRIFSDGEWENHPLLKDFTLGWKEKLGESLRGDRYKDLFLRAAWESVGSGSKAACSEVWKTNEIFEVDNTADRDPVWYPPELTCWRRMGPASPVIPVTIPRRCAPKIGGTCIPDYLESSSDLSDFSPRKRCLFAFPEVCTPVSFLPTLADAMDVLRETHIALTLMFCAGWVHRDISVGNVLAIKNDGESGWHVKLADLEYAQRFPSDDTGSVAAQIGTPSFMAYEIESSTNMYQEPPSPSSSTSSMEDLLSKLHNPRPHVPITVAKHTFAHDSESLWWLVLWILTVHVGHEKSYCEACKYFCEESTRSRRRGTKSLERRYLLQQGGLPILHPNLNLVRRALERVRYIICSGYTTRHPVNQLQDLGTYVNTCAAFPAFFDVVNREDKRAIWGPMKLYPMGHIAPAQKAPAPEVAQPASKKRKYEQDQEGGLVEEAQESSTSSKEMLDTTTDQPPPSKKPRL